MRRLSLALPLLFACGASTTSPSPADSGSDGATDASNASDGGALVDGGDGRTFVYGNAPPVLTHHNDNARTGTNDGETVLTPSTLTSGAFGLAFSRKVQGFIYAQPLFVPKLSVGARTRDVVFVATEHNDAYAFDAEDPNASEPLWHANFGPSIPSTDFDADQGTPYRDIVPELGVTSTPVIDLQRKAIFFFAQSKENGEYINRLHALDITTGQERWNSPRVVTISGPGTGAGSTNGVVTIPPKFVLQRPALALSGAGLWVVGGGHGDFGPYHGWVQLYIAKDLLPHWSTYLTTPGGWAGGVWQSGGGPALDSLGETTSAFIETGNGTYDASASPRDLSESFLRVDGTIVCPEGWCGVANLGLGDWFTPHDHDALDAADMDLGSSGPMIIPKTDLLVGGGKQGKLYVTDRTKMGHLSADDAQIVQSFQGTTGELYAGLVYWSGPAGKRLYVLGQEDAVKAYRFTPNGPLGTFDTTPYMQSAFTVPAGTPGAAMSLTSSGSAPGTGVLWVLSQESPNEGSWFPGAAALRALDADDLSRELWSSANDAKDAVGKYVKFTVPTVTGGRVFVPGVDVLRVYALESR